MISKRAIQAELTKARNDIKEFCENNNRSYRLAISNNELVSILCKILEDDAECCNNCVHCSSGDTISCVCGVTNETEPICHCCEKFMNYLQLGAYME